MAPIRILSLDSSTAAISVAVVDGDRVLASASEEMVHGHAERLVPMLDATMADAGIAYSALDRIAVTVGPGTFTGMRVGLATARALAVALDIPCVGVSTFRAVAAGINPSESPERERLIVIDSRRADLFAAFHRPDGEPLGDPFTATPADLAARCRDRAVLLAGDAADKTLPVLRSEGVDACLSAAPRHPDAARLADLAKALTAEHGPPAPLYLRAPDAALPRHGGSLRP